MTTLEYWFTPVWSFYYPSVPFVSESSPKYRIVPEIGLALIVSNEKSVDSVKLLAYNDIKAEGLSVDEPKEMKLENAGI